MRIKLSLEGVQSADLSQFTGNKTGEIDGCEIFVDARRTVADAWFVIENVNPEDKFCVVPDNQIHFLSAETSYAQSHYLNPSLTEFLSQFALIHSCHPVPLKNVVFSPPFLPWMINANHESIFKPHQRDLKFFENLQEVPKSKKLSVFCSEQDYTPEHKLRLAFVKLLKAYFGEDIDWFGNGINPVPTKWEGLAAYERTIVLENRSDRSVYTEKILDPFLSLTTPIYWGAPDIESYLPVRPERLLDIRDFGGSIQTIKNVIASPPSEEEKASQLLGKERVTGQLHFLRRIVEKAKSRAAEGARVPVSETSLRPREDFRRKNLDRAPRKTALDRAYLFARKAVKGY